MNDTTQTEMEIEIRLLREKLAYYEAIFEFPELGIAIASLDGQFLKVNHKLCEILGYSKEELIGRTYMEITDPGDLEEDRKCVEKVLKGEIPSFAMDKRYIKKNGKLTWIHLIATLSRNQDNSPAFFVAYIKEILERKNAEVELENHKKVLEGLVEERTGKLNKVNLELKSIINMHKNSEMEIQNQLEVLRTLIEAIPNPIYIKSPERKYIDCNKALTELYGFTKEQAIGRTVYDITPLDYAKRIDESDKRVISELSSDESEVEITDSLHRKRIVLINKTVILRSDGTAGGIVGVITDITEQRRLQIKIERALKKEKDLNELKSRFISMASHEFRTPLTSIKLFSDLLFNYGKELPEEKSLTYKEKIHNTINYMTELIDDVLTISREDTGKTTFNPAETDLYQLCQDIITDCKINSPDRSIILTFSCNKRIFNIDVKLLKLIFSNLISNALKYSPVKSVVDFSVQLDGTRLIFHVKDRGIGITDSDKKRLFEYFHRGENTGNIPGTGLGLAIVRKSVGMHRGKIDFNSQVNKGTDFTVTIPVRLK